MCRVEICDRDAEAQGYYQAHYKRVQKHGHPQADIPIRGTSGGHVNTGYRYVSVPKKLRAWSGGESKMAEHRLVMATPFGRPLRGDENVQNVNGDKLDNRLENLELWSTSQPSAKRVEDLLEFAQVIIEMCGEEFGLFARTA